MLDMLDPAFFTTMVLGIIGRPNCCGCVYETELRSRSSEDSVPESMFVEKPDESMISEFATQFDSTWDGI